MIAIIEKLKRKGFLGAVKFLLSRFETYIDRLIALKKLKSAQFRVIFTHEGNHEIQMPAISYWDVIVHGADQLNRETEFSLRPQREVLLRKVVFDLFEQGYIDRNQSIIDIGCWLGDNALVWAKLIEGGGVIHAIDPSGKNLIFGQELASMNGIHNIRWVNAVCAEKSGMPLAFTGNIDHACFTDAVSTSSTPLISTTLDEIIKNSESQSISLMHIDVEGFEEKVLRGAEHIIDIHKPIIIFEQHIGLDNVQRVLEFLKVKGYAVFMINEVLPECDLDCRNFIAFDSKRPLPRIKAIEHCNGRGEGVWYASIQKQLIAVE